MARTKLKKDAAAAAKVAARFSAWRPASEVLIRVEAMPTIFPQYDLATRVGGHPIRRVSLVHGPSGHGKTAFVLGLGLSFLQRGHFFAYVDAEYTTPEDWLQSLMAQHADNPCFVANRPHDYEEVVHGVRDFVNVIAKARNEGEIAEDVTSLIVIDSIRKLVPKGLLTKMLKGKDGLDGAKGRAAMMKAALNAQWLDELTPLLYHTKSSLMFIARETENPNASQWEPKTKVGGGSALLYDSSLAMRVVRAGYVREKTKSQADEDGDKGRIFGERHRVEIHKTKVGGREDRVETCHFHTSNGLWTPAGFDCARDVLEVAVEGGIVDRRGAWFSYDGKKLGQGEHNAVKHLSGDDELLGRVEADVRKHCQRKG